MDRRTPFGLTGRRPVGTDSPRTERDGRTLETTSNSSGRSVPPIPPLTCATLMHSRIDDGLVELATHQLNPALAAIFANSLQFRPVELDPEAGTARVDFIDRAVIADFQFYPQGIHQVSVSRRLGIVEAQPHLSAPLVPFRASSLFIHRAPRSWPKPRPCPSNPAGLGRTPTGYGFAAQGYVPGRIA